MNKRQQAALEIIKAGGYIRHALETQYRGGEKFEYRLFDAQRNRVMGYGFAALEPLTHIVPRDHSVWYGSTARREYRFQA